MDYGTYPYVTSSHPVSGGIGIGAGVAPNRLDTIVGVVKAYCTRVGEGPFPTEQLNEVGEKLREVVCRRVVILQDQAFVRDGELADLIESRCRW